MRLALAARNPTIGAIEENARAAIEAIAQARDAGADLLCLSELFLCGYPPRDLLLQEGFLDECRRQAERVAAQARGLVVLLGAPWLVHPDARRRGAANALLVLRDGGIADRYDKRLLPTYDVFDEDRYFISGERAVVIDVAGVRVGLAICEDLWRGADAGFDARYQGRPDPVAELAAAGAQLIVSPSASPYVFGKSARQREILTHQVRAHGLAIAAVNQLGANDELIFDGAAVVLAPDPSSDDGARLVAASPPFREHMLVSQVPANGFDTEDLPPAVPDPALEEAPMRRLWEALRLGVADYCRKTGFQRAVIGLSGGIDSTAVTCLAVGALGAENILCVAMPSRHSSEHSVTDAEALARSLGVRLVEVPIEAPHAAMEDLLKPAFEQLGADAEPGVTEENIQARLRGVILMAFSNKLGSLLLTTGNKSEMAVGYCTLYGDMNGGLAVLADVTKQHVYRLCEWINDNPSVVGVESPPIPESVLTKPPSAELKPGQLDEDTLPPYHVLDEMIRRYIEERQSPATIVVETGFDRAIVARVARMIDVNEYKRRQAPPGLKVSSVAFGTGRRIPIAEGWRPERSLLES